MGGATLTTAAETLRETFVMPQEEGLFRQDGSFLKIFGPPVQSLGTDSYKWKIRTSGNSTPASFSEGDAMPDPGNQGWSDAERAYGHFWFSMSVTGHLIAASKDPAIWINAVEEEFSLGQLDLIDYITTDAMSELETIIDSTSAYAGITRGSTWFDSQETAVSGALTQESMEDMLESLRNAEVGAKPDLILCAPNQLTNAYRLAGGPAIQYISDKDKAPNLQSQSFAGIPILDWPDLTNSIMFFLDRSKRNFQVVEHEGFRVHDQSRSGDSQVYLATHRLRLIGRSPRLQGKLTGITA